jgi:transcriptional regulator with XRE-family HTH domain
MARPLDTPEIKYIAQNIARLREAAGLTQAQLAERAGLQPRAISIIEGGLSDLSVSTLCKIAKALGVPPGRLLRTVRSPLKRRPGGRPPKRRKSS